MHISNMNKYVEIAKRIDVDFDNEGRFAWDIIGLTKYDYIQNLSGEKIELFEGQYVYLCMKTDDNPLDYVVAEGTVIRNTFNSKPCKWYCKIVGKIEYIDDYNQKFGNVSD